MRIDLSEPGRLTAFLRERCGPGTLPEIQGITIDSRKTRPGDLFVALPGSRVDGCAFIPQAVASGAVAVMVAKEAALPPSPVVPVIRVSDSIKELGALAQSWRDSFALPVVALTGSNGKTTTKNLIIEVLRKKFKVLGTDSSYNSTIGLPLTLLRLGANHEVAVLELGSNQPGEIAYLSQLARPDIGLVTNVSATHVAHLGDKQGVIREKGALFKALPSQGTAVVNLDDPAVAAMATAARRLTYGFDHPADIRGEYRQDEAVGELAAGGLRIRLPQSGHHLAQNALAAVAIGQLFEVEGDLIKAAIETFSLPAGRGEIQQYNGVTVINDSYNANLASTLAGLETMQQLPVEGKRIAVVGDMLELGRFSEEHHRRVAEFAATHGVDVMLCFGPETRATYCSAISAGIRAHHFADKSEMNDVLERTMAAGDVVYIKGSRGMAMESIIEEVFNR